MQCIVLYCIGKLNINIWGHFVTNVLLPHQTLVTKSQVYSHKSCKLSCLTYAISYCLGSNPVIGVQSSCSFETVLDIPLFNSVLDEHRRATVTRVARFQSNFQPKSYTENLKLSQKRLGIRKGIHIFSAFAWETRSPWYTCTFKVRTLYAPFPPLCTLSVLTLCLCLQKFIQLDMYPIIIFVAEEQHDFCSNGKRSATVANLRRKMAMSCLGSKRVFCQWLKPNDLLKRGENAITTIEANASIDRNCKDIYNHIWCTYTPFSADLDSLPFMLITYSPDHIFQV